jgi:SAM-dependent methyltransferase
MSKSDSTKWPKILPPLTTEQERTNNDFVKLWHEVLPKRFGVVERFNHSFPVKHSQPGFRTTLEIGAGLGEHLSYEKLTTEQEENYYCNELRENMAVEIRRRFPKVRTIVADCQQRMDFPNECFDRALAVHVLEHLPNLPACIREVHRLLNKESGQFLVVIPTEGSPAYSFARKISAERVYKKRYGGSYKWFYTREHINLPHEIVAELNPYFTVESRSFFPLPFLPVVFCNLCIGLVLKPRPRPLSAHP